MATYMSSAGPVIVVHYPIVQRGGATDTPLPPIQIETAQSATATAPVGLVVYEPYGVVPVSHEEEV